MKNHQRVKKTKQKGTLVDLWILVGTVANELGNRCSIRLSYGTVDFARDPVRKVCNVSGSCARYSNALAFSLLVRAVALRSVAPAAYRPAG
jgi:hypothetical protein